MITVTPETRIQVRNILLATDFSSSADAALPHALALARRYDAQLFVAHVVRPDLFELVPSEESGALRESARRHADEQMTRLLVSGRLRGIPHQVLVAEGALWHVLAREISAHEIDLVVVGTRGRTGSSKLLLGSVAEEIFRLAPCPVLTVGPRVADHATLDSPHHVLYATDFRSESERAAAYAVSLAQENQAHLTLMHVVKDSTDSSAPGMAMLREFFTRRLKGLVPPEAELWCEPEFLTEFGDPAETIMQAARERNAELIVLGIRRVATFAGHLPPATAYKVVCQSRCPVLTIRGS
jgi:nucleotide-binding universal stress UspA family protein